MHHHPEHHLLEQYAAGTLSLPLSIGISAHLSFCSACRRRVDDFHTVGAQLFDTLSPAPVADDLFAKVMASIDSPSPMDSVVMSPSKKLEGIPRALRKLIPNGFDDLKWEWQLPSLSVADIGLSDSSFQVALHRIKAGGRVFEHDHQGNEFTLVLKGSFSDDYGCYSDGDFILRQSNEAHSPTAAQNEECICLTIQQAPVKFTGLFTQLLNPLVR